MEPDTFLKELLFNEEQSDVRVIVENKMGEANFPAHSLVLKRRSPVIAKMLESDFVEGRTKTIVIADFQVNYIEAFLTYLYTDIIPETYADLCELVKIADKYLVSKLPERCEESLMDLINLQNVYELCSLADAYSLAKLREECLFLITRAGFKLLKYSNLKYVSKEIMEDIVRDNTLNVSKEIDVFWAIWRWGNFKFCRGGVAYSNENVAEFIEELLKYVRWNLTDEDEQEKVISLGIKVDVADLRRDCQSRKPSTVGIPWFLDLCDILNVHEDDSCCLQIKEFIGSTTSDENAVNMMRAVSFSDSPFFIVGVLLACTKNLIGAKLISSCESSVSAIEIPQQSDKTLAISATKGETRLNYQEIMYEFPNPIEVCKNKVVLININKFPNFGSVEMKFNGKSLFSNKGRELFMCGDVTGIKKIFLLRSFRTCFSSSENC